MSVTASPAVTLHEAAEMLGVHYMTAYRYVRLGLLAASKSGGVWQVEVADLAEFKAGGPSSPQPARGSQRRAPWADRLEARLIAGDAHGAWQIQSRQRSGISDALPGFDGSGFGHGRIGQYRRCGDRYS